MFSSVRLGSPSNGVKWLYQGHKVRTRIKVPHPKCCKYMTTIGTQGCRLCTNIHTTCTSQQPGSLTLWLTQIKDDGEAPCSAGVASVCCQNCFELPLCSLLSPAVLVLFISQELANTISGTLCKEVGLVECLACARVPALKSCIHGWSPRGIKEERNKGRFFLCVKCTRKKK